MQRNAKNAEKCTEMKRNIGKCREMQICRDILITFMTFVTFMKHGNVIFDILDHACVDNVIHPKAVLFSILNTESK